MTNKYIFIDRDGVINKDPGGWTEFSYVTHPRLLQFLPGALQALRKLKHAGFKVLIISNQAGVGKGHFTRADLEEVNRTLCAEVKRAGGQIQESFYCTHRKEDECSCRKPKSGLLEKAAKKYRVKVRETYFIGDSDVDMEAGARIGVPTVFVLSGKRTREDMRKFACKPDYVFADLREAVDWILTKEKRRAERAIRRRSEPRTKGGV